MCEKLKQLYEQYEGQCVVDSAFSKDHYLFLIKSSQDCVVGSEGTAASIATLRQATSALQSSEWGVPAFKGTFARLQDRFIMKRDVKVKLS